MKIIFAIPLSLFLIISVLLLSGHFGTADKVSIISFFLLLGGVIWGLKKGSREI